MLSKFTHFQDLEKFSKRNEIILQQLETLDSAKVDKIFQNYHRESFETMNCLECANCCRNYSPILEQADIERLLKTLNMSSTEFFTDLVEMDNEGDFVFKSKPCPMLDLTTNKCSIYENRPKACAEYPHTEIDNILDYFDIVEKNALICPAVNNILERIEIEISK